jgi:hypothetical protein
MKMPADSVLLASASLVAIGLLRLMDRFGCCKFGGRLEVFGFLAPWILLLLLPPIMLFTVAYAIRDLFRRGARLQALLAFALLIPVWVFLTSIRL